MSSGSNRQLCNLNKPAFSKEQATELVKRVFGIKVSEIKPLPSYDDQNFHVRVAKSEEIGEGTEEEYVLKIINSEDSQNPELIEVQTRIMMFLNKEGFPVATPHFTKEGEIMYLESVETASATKEYMVRLLSYLPGKTVATLPIGPPVLYEVGQLAARLDKTLTEKFQHPLIKRLHRGEFIWNLANVPLLKQYVYALGQSSYLEVVKQVIEQFSVKIVPNLSSFQPIGLQLQLPSLSHSSHWRRGCESQSNNIWMATHCPLLIWSRSVNHTALKMLNCINHGDLNDHNILIDTDSTSLQNPRYRVSGILDFSDMSYGYYIFEVAITIMYMMIESKDPLSVGGHVLAGFESIVALTAEERAALFLLVCGRFTQSLVMAAHTSLLHPENKEYLMITAKTGWKHLMTLFEMGQEAVEKIWFETAKTYT
ncbi:hydroxylysine kinase isoform X1 [Sceloporus undulatus]|uniref:hydroxylysine kinase isoform X1 n=1 Tax=Sceloporus undulatus TaxID=8520 RepID=UPI001C4B56EB|nr:hydroxylysine kinase isoform X1 [Sceloporus undulatus]XP_042328693.1 hydroxylysine kinase isoform X1 [Sceloporus undulatus]